MRISTNIPGLRAMKSSTVAEKRLEQISRHLSTGVKISSVRDDPTGSAVSNKLQMQKGGTQVAAQNSMNAISVLQTAEAGLNEVHSILHRMREMAVQASNDTLSSADRLKLQIEIDQLKEEIDSISDRTDYNKTKLLNGHAGLKAKSTDAKILGMTDGISAGTYTIEVTAPATATSMGPLYLTTGIFPSETLAGTITINDIDVTITGEDTWEAAFAKFDEAAKAVSITASVDKTGTHNSMSMVSDYLGSAHEINVSSSNEALLQAFGFRTSGNIYVAGDDAQIKLIDGFSTAAKYSADGNRITITDGNNQRMVLELDPSLTVGGIAEITVTDNSLVFQTGGNKDLNIEVAIGEISSASLNIDRLSVATLAGSQRAITQLDAAIGQCSLARGKVGSFANRFELVNSNLESADMLLQKTMSKIFDTDMAYEMAEYSRNQVVQQGALAILGQANQRPQQVLQLLK